MVKQAYEDPSRTKAACELVHAGIMCLAQKVRTEHSYESCTPGTQIRLR